MNVFGLTSALVDIESITNNEERAGNFLFDLLTPLAARFDCHMERIEVEPRRFNVFAGGIFGEALGRRHAPRLRRLHRRSAGAPTPQRPPRPVIYMEEANRPQPRKDAERARGMAAFVGRLRACPVLDYKFVVLGHNTIRGAAGAAVLNTELMHSEGMLLP